MSVINRSAWSPEEQEEYEELLAAVTASGRESSARLDVFERLLADAIQAHRPWAREVERACLRGGMGKEISRYQGRMRALVAHDGRVLNEPRIQSRKVRTADGATVDQRELIELWTWEQIAEKRVEAIRMRGSYDDKIAHYDRLLALRVLAPDSVTPTEAAAVLDVDLDEYLATPEGKAA